jgi:hypothetical protein
MKPIQNSYLIEVNLGATLPGAGANLTFQDYPQLRNIYVTGVEVLDVTTCAVSPSGKNAVSVLSGITVTLIDTFNQEQLKQYPAADLNPEVRSGFYRDFVPFPLQLTKSFITILTNTGLGANQSVLLNIFYLTDKQYKAQTQKKTISKLR